MGLDMYLSGIEDLTEINVETREFKIKEMRTDEIYWRKANHIHKWFVDNVQDGCDNCARYYVSENNLIKLKELCEQVLSNRDKADEILPTQGGFFFGSTDYDDYYFHECKRTLDEINRLLKEKKYEYYEYSSSW